MRLLFDQNISPQLVERLSDIFPGCEHVRNVGLRDADDQRVWQYARDEDLVIVSKDEDFHQLSFLYGPPPKVVWLRLGNCTTEEIETAIRKHQHDLVSFGDEGETAFLIVGEAEEGV